MADGSFSFPEALRTGTQYTVTIAGQPSSSRCALANASGTVAAENIANVQLQGASVDGFVYAISTPASQIQTYRLNLTTGTLLPYGTPAALPSGSLPKDLIASPDGSMLYASDWNLGTIDSFSINASSGLVTAAGSYASSTTQNPQPDQMILSPQGNFLYLANLNANEVALFDVNSATGGLTPGGVEISYPTRSGASFAQTPDGRFLYVLSNQMLGSSTPTLTVYAVAANNGALTAGSMLTVPNGSAL